MEVCVPNSLWIVRVSGHALHERPCILPIKVFRDILDVCVALYLDDIMIYSDNSSEHLRHVREFLRRLRTMQNHLYAKVKECDSAWTRRTSSVPFLALTAFKWTPPRSKSSATGRHHEMPRTINCSWAPRYSTVRRRDGRYCPCRPFRSDLRYLGWVIRRSPRK